MLQPIILRRPELAIAVAELGVSEVVELLEAIDVDLGELGELLAFLSRPSMACAV
jgi:hypothetical protein